MRKHRHSIFMILLLVATPLLLLVTATPHSSETSDGSRSGGGDKKKYNGKYYSSTLQVSKEWVTNFTLDPYSSSPMAGHILGSQYYLLVSTSNAKELVTSNFSLFSAVNGSLLWTIEEEGEPHLVLRNGEGEGGTGSDSSFFYLISSSSNGGLPCVSTIRVPSGNREVSCPTKREAREKESLKSNNNLVDVATTLLIDSLGTNAEHSASTYEVNKATLCKDVIVMIGVGRTLVGSSGTKSWNFLLGWSIMKQKFNFVIEGRNNNDNNNSISSRLLTSVSQNKLVPDSTGKTSKFGFIAGNLSDIGAPTYAVVMDGAAEDLSELVVLQHKISGVNRQVKIVTLDSCTIFYRYDNAPPSAKGSPYPNYNFTFVRLHHCGGTSTTNLPRDSCPNWTLVVPYFQGVHQMGCEPPKTTTRIEEEQPAGGLSTGMPTCGGKPFSLFYYIQGAIHASNGSTLVSVNYTSGKIVSQYPHHLPAWGDDGSTVTVLHIRPFIFGPVVQYIKYSPSTSKVVTGSGDGNAISSSELRRSIDRVSVHSGLNLSNVIFNTTTTTEDGGANHSSLGCNFLKMNSNGYDSFACEMVHESVGKTSPSPASPETICLFTSNGKKFCPGDSSPSSSSFLFNTIAMEISVRSEELSDSSFHSTLQLGLHGGAMSSSMFPLSQPQRSMIVASLNIKQPITTVAHHHRDDSSHVSDAPSMLQLTKFSWK